jgi:hypothetical protein
MSSKHEKGDRKIALFDTFVHASQTLCGKHRVHTCERMTHPSITHVANDECQAGFPNKACLVCPVC